MIVYLDESGDLGFNPDIVAGRVIEEYSIYG